MYIIGSLDFLSTEDKEKLLNSAKGYADDEFELFKAETGWEDWMNEFTDAEDGEPCSERELKEIDKVLLEVWNQTH